MNLYKGMQVKVLAGKYKGLIMMIIAISDASVYVADGRNRKLEKPKKLNLKHIEVLDTSPDKDIEKKIENKTLTNNMLWKRLRSPF